MLMRALYTVSGDALRASFCKQQELLKHLYESAKQVQGCKESQRNNVSDCVQCEM